MENQAVEVIKARTNRVVAFIQTDFHMQLVCIEGHMLWTFKPYPWFFLNRYQAKFLGKIQKHTSWRHSQLAYVKMITKKWHMPIWGKKCHFEQKYMPFSSRSLSGLTGEKSKAHKHIQIDMMLRCRFFLGNRARWRSCVFDFFPQDSRIRV